MLRVTQNLYFQSTQRNVSQSLGRLYSLQEQISTGRRILNPSDDPSGASRLIGIKRNISEIDQFAKNAVQGRDFTESSDTAIQSMSRSIAKVRETVVQALNETYSNEDRKTLADEIDGEIQNIFALANTRFADSSVFGGTATDQAPFRFDSRSNGRDVVNYLGNDQSIRTEIGFGIDTPLNVTGAELFRVGQRGDTVFDGRTGVQASSSGTDSGTGVGRLEVKHLSTTWFGGGVLPGADSANGDTILGPSHRLTITTDVTGAGKIALNGGDMIDFNGSETNLKIEGPDGEVAYLDVSSVAPNFSGNVGGSTTGSYSLDGGVSTTPISFASDFQRVYDSETGEVINVDSRSVTQAGTESVLFEGANDLFSLMVGIRDELREVGSGREIGEDLDFVRSMLSELEEAQNRLLQSAGTVGTVAARLEAAENRLADEGLRAETQRSRLEDIDIADAASRLTAAETTYQSTLLVTARVGQLSLLNFLS